MSLGYLVRYYVLDGVRTILAVWALLNLKG